MLQFYSAFHAEGHKMFYKCWLWLFLMYTGKHRVSSPGPDLPKIYAHFYHQAYKELHLSFSEIGCELKPGREGESLQLWCHTVFTEL